MTDLGRQLCFVDMPFGLKRDLKTATLINFDQIYEKGIQPGIEKAKIQAIRGDHERVGGIIHTAMFARLLLSEFVIADLTTANANVFYELGIRHTAKPFTTIPIFASLGEIPFDLSLIRAIPYELVKGELTVEGAKQLAEAIYLRIRRALEGPTTKDSPLFDLFENYPGIEMSHELTDVFRDRVTYSEKLKEQLADIRYQNTDAKTKQQALLTFEQSLGDLKTRERGVLVDLLLSYRSVDGWQQIVELFDKLPADVQESTVVLQQFAMALNRTAKEKNRRKALQILTKLIAERGESAESRGLLGRIYKDYYTSNRVSNPDLASGYLDLSIESYTIGFECEPLDFYPGINAITLLLQKGTSEARLAAERLAPLVAFAVTRLGGATSTDYWTVATVVELAAIQNDTDLLEAALPRLVSLAIDVFQPRTTAGNLKLILAMRKAGDDTAILEKAIAALTDCERRLKG